MIKLNIEDIKKLIPHRNPFLFIDDLTIIEKGKIGEAFKIFEKNLWNKNCIFRA